MDVLVVLARLLLAGVFVVSGVGKLLDLAGSERAMRGFGVPEPLAKPAGLALPLAELAIAILLLPVTTATLGGVLALLLLVAFVVGVGYNLSRGRRPDCHCFGQLHSEPIGWRTLATEGVLAAVALFVAVNGLAGRPGPSIVGWIGRLTTFEAVMLVVGVLLVAAVAGMAWLLVHLLGQNGRLLVRLDKIEEALAEHDIEIPADEEEEAEEEEGLPYGSPAPAFTLTGVHGETMTLDALRAQSKPVLLVFSDPGCGPCNALMPDVGRWQRDLAAKMTVAVVSGGDPAANKAKSDEHGLINVLLQKESEVSNLYRVNGTPTGILVRADGTIGSKAALGAEEIRTLAKQIANNRVPVPSAANGKKPAAPRPAPQPVAGLANVGKPAPAVSLADLDGRTVTLAEFNGQPTAVLFWNPGCGFCQRMLPDLKAWEENPPADAPKLLVVSTGEAERNKEQGLRSPVLLDDGFSVGRAFGASGTPSAVLVDGEGNVASGISVGAPSVLALLRNEAPAPAANGSREPEPEPEPPAIGTPAPAVKLTDIDGNAIDLADHRGTRTLLVFWNPGCGFCQRMLPDLKAWEENPPKGAPKLMLVSTGEPEDNRAQGLRSPILLDQSFSTGSAFGADGTPSAIMVDARGNVASKLAVGANEVMELARSTRDPQPAIV